MLSAIKISGSVCQLLTRHRPSVSFVGPSLFHTAEVLEAARKGTRAKAEAKKRAHKKEVVVKKEFVPKKKRLELQTGGLKSPRRQEDHLKEAVDDVWFAKYYKHKVYSLRDALEMHRETHHETQMNTPGSCIKAVIELDLSLDKANRFMDSFTDVVKLPHAFDTEQQRNTLVVSQNQEFLAYARQVGSNLALGTEIIKMAQTNEIDLNEYNYVLSDVDLLPELVAIRGLMKRQFPNVRNGTAGTDLISIMDRFIKGVEYRTDKNKLHQDYATIEAPFGRLNMTDEQLEDNLATLVNNIGDRRQKQRKSSDLVTKVTVMTPLSIEKFHVHYAHFLESQDEMDVKQVAQ